MTITVRLLASIPWVTSSAVEAEPNPLEPGLPVINEKIPIFPENVNDDFCPLLLEIKTQRMTRKKEIFVVQCLLVSFSSPFS